MGYLGISVLERWAVPQVVVIDRQGQVRAQSLALSSPELQDQAYMRKLITDLLKEGGAPATGKNQAPGARKTPVSAAAVK